MTRDYTDHTQAINLASVRYNLLRDGQTILFNCSEIEAMNYVHKHHAFSFDWALKFEGYSLEVKRDGNL